MDLIIENNNHYFIGILHLDFLTAFAITKLANSLETEIPKSKGYCHLRKDFDLIPLTYTLPAHLGMIQCFHKDKLALHQRGYHTLNPCKYGVYYLKGGKLIH